MYFSEKGRMVQDPVIRGGLPMAGMKHSDNEWHAYTLSATVPAVAHSVRIWPHTYSTAQCLRRLPAATVA